MKSPSRARSLTTRLFFLVVVTVALVVSCYALINVRQTSNREVIALPDPPAYQESLPNPPPAEKVEPPAPSAVNGSGLAPWC